MTPERWERIDLLFHAALKRGPAGRTAFLTRECAGDEPLREEVESLLASLEEADDFIETPASDVAAELFGGEQIRLEAGQEIGRYTVVEMLGEGGMGEVYLATDKKLDRQVAIKILNRQFSQRETDLRRFEQEARTASALDHPNILVIHEIGEADGAHYIVSEYVKGKTLREIVGRSPMELPDVLEIATQIASALSAAHRAGLVHRDVKPENIIVRPDGYVKILDFGLAKLVEQTGGPHAGGEAGAHILSGDGLILGTPDYMSPEQARGEKVDARSDIFSFGAVLYEMLAGKAPFAGASRVETAANLMAAEPRPLSDVAAGVPDKMQTIVARALRKNRDERYRTMGEAHADLKELKENLAFEEKLRRFAAAPKVLTGRSKQNESEDDPHQSQIAEPANAYQAYQLWRYHYHQIAPPDLIRAHVLLEEAVRLDPDFALAHAASAVQEVQEVIIGLCAPAESFPRAKAALQRASELDPHSAEFYAAAGFVDMVCDWNFQEAERKVRKALELNSHHAFANNYLGQIFMFRCRPDEAEPYLQRAREIEPMGLHNNTVSIMSYFLGRNYGKVIEECENALALYPRYFIAAQVRCWALEQAGRAAEAVAEYEKILGEPHGVIARRWMGYAYALVGDRESALDTAAHLVAESREHYLSPTHLAQLYAGLNETDTAFFYLEDAVEKRDPWMLWIAADPRYDNLRADPRFAELVGRVGLGGARTADGAARETLSSGERRERLGSPGSKNATAVLRAAGDANKQAAAIRRGSSTAVKRYALPGALALVALLAGLFVWKSQREQTEAVRFMRPTQITTWTSLDIYPSFSPDGNAVAYSSDHGGGFEIYVKPLAPGAGETRLTSDGQQNFQPAFSPDGKLIAFYSKNRGGIWVIPAAGGEARQLTSFGSRPAWSPDGRLIAFQSNPITDLGAGATPATAPSTIWTVPAQGGAPAQLTRRGEPAGGHGSPAWSPDGRRVVFCVSDFVDGSIWTVASAGGDLKQIVKGYLVDAVYAPDGEGIYYGSEYGLWKIRVSRATGEPVGEPVELANTSPARLRHFAVSADGRKIAYAPLSIASNILSISLSPASFEAAGEPAPLTQNRRFRNSFPSFSPDGKKIAYQSFSVGGESNIWLMDADGRNVAQATTEGGFCPSWFPGGGQILFSSNRRERWKAWATDLTTRQDRLLLDPGEDDVQYLQLSPDGRQIVFNSKKSGTTNVAVIPASGGEARQLTSDRELAGFACWSPDGSVLAFEIKRGDDTHLAVMPSGGGEVTQLTFDRGQSWPHSFAPDGDRVVFAGFRDGLWNLYWVSRSTGRQQRLTSYTKLNSYVRYPAWSPLGNQIAYEYAETTGNIWIADLK